MTEKLPRRFANRSIMAILASIVFASISYHPSFSRIHEIQCFGYLTVGIVLWVFGPLFLLLIIRWAINGDRGDNREEVV